MNLIYPFKKVENQKYDMIFGDENIDKRHETLLGNLVNFSQYNSFEEMMEGLIEKSFEKEKNFLKAYNITIEGNYDFKNFKTTPYDNSNLTKKFISQFFQTKEESKAIDIFKRLHSTNFRDKLFSEVEQSIYDKIKVELELMQTDLNSKNKNFLKDRQKRIYEMMNEAEFPEEFIVEMQKLIRDEYDRITLLSESHFTKIRERPKNLNELYQIFLQETLEQEKRMATNEEMEKFFLDAYQDVFILGSNKITVENFRKKIKQQPKISSFQNIKYVSLSYTRMLEYAQMIIDIFEESNKNTILNKKTTSNESKAENSLSQEEKMINSIFKLLNIEKNDPLIEKIKNTLINKKNLIHNLVKEKLSAKEISILEFLNLEEKNTTLLQIDKKEVIDGYQACHIQIREDKKPDFYIKNNKYYKLSNKKFEEISNIEDYIIKRLNDTISGSRGSRMGRIFEVLFTAFIQAYFEGQEYSIIQTGELTDDNAKEVHYDVAFLKNKNINYDDLPNTLNEVPAIGFQLKEYLGNKGDIFSFYEAEGKDYKLSFPYKNGDILSKFFPKEEGGKINNYLINNYYFNFVESKTFLTNLILPAMRWNSYAYNDIKTRNLITNNFYVINGYLIPTSLILFFSYKNKMNKINDKTNIGEITAKSQFYFSDQKDFINTFNDINKNNKDNEDSITTNLANEALKNSSIIYSYSGLSVSLNEIINIIGGV